MDSYTMISHPCQHGFYLAHINLLKSTFFSYYLPKSKILFLKIPQGHDIPRGKTSYVPLQHPLRQQQQHETRQPQNADGQGVQQVQSQRNTGNGSGGVHRPQSQKPQCRIHQQLQGKAQGRPEDPQQCDEKKSQQQAGNDFLIQVHTAPPLADPAATGSRAFSTRR